MPSLKESAIHYAELGYHVFPLKPHQKTPATRNGFKDASDNPGTVEAWWLQNPDYNIGIATGHGLVVVDIDNHPEEGKDGLSTLREWENEHGELKPTWTVLTGTGGYHYWYTTDQDYKNAVEILPAIDIRSLGGYVVAPPSIHPNGDVYQWEALGDPEDTPIAPLEGSALQLVRMTFKKKEQQSSESTYKGLTEIGKGHRQAVLMSLIGRLKNMDLTDDAIMAAIRYENDAKCKPPMTEEELQKEIFPFLKRDITPHSDWTSTVLPVNDLDPSDFPKPVQLSTIWSSPPPLAPVLIEGILRQGHKMIISGPSKAGKSYLLIELAYSIAEGQNWCGCRCTQGKVLYVNMEIENASFYKRVKEVYKAHGMDAGIHPDNIIVWGLRGHSMPITELAPKIIEVAKKEGCIAIIIDPLYKVLKGDENSNSDIAEMSKGFDRIAQETKCSVIYAHHFAKGYAGDKQSIDRGSGAGTFSRDPDAILTMTQLDVDSESATAWRIEYTLREFPNKKSTDMWWAYPIHKLDPKLAMYDVVSQKTAQQKIQKRIAKKQTIDIVRDVVESVPKVDDQGGFTTTDFIAEYELIEKVGSRNTAEKRLKDAGFIKTTETNGKPGIWHKK